MIILGLTGSIAMGKSTTADMFRAEGIPVHDADKTVHDLYKNEAVKPVKEIFPDAVIDGKVDRQALGRLVLGNRNNMQKLEKLIHPMVRKKEQEFLQTASKNKAELVVLDIPLLFETGGNKRVDATLVVTASAQEQEKRVMSRPGMTKQKFASILKHQIPDAEKRQKADFIIDTSLGMEKARQSVRGIIATLRQSSKET
ncbi:MAG: dephospho-CoA kinase [Rhizobiaceae bacterium]|nr:dephospho-CoA kinase [Rhizobiaceae bacterium]